MSKHSDDPIPPTWKLSGNGNWTDTDTGDTFKLMEKYKQETRGAWYHCKVPGCRRDLFLRRNQNVSQYRKYAKDAHEKGIVPYAPVESNDTSMTNTCIPCVNSNATTAHTSTNVQSLTSINSSREFDGTTEITTTKPDGTVTFEKRVGKETTTEQRVIAMQMQITKLEKTIAEQNDEKLNAQMDDKRRIQSLLAQEKASDEERIRQQKESLIALRSNNEHASPLDVYLLTLLADRHKRMFETLPENQRQALIASPISDTNGWDAFTRAPFYTDGWADKLNKVASDPTLFKNYFPLASSVVTPENVMELHLWPNMIEQEDEEHEIEEVVFEEEEPDTAALSPLEKVPISQWTSERMETALQYCLTKPWCRVERTSNQRYSPPQLVKVIDKHKDYTAVSLDAQKRIKNEKNIARLRCRFRHSSGAEKDIWIKEAMLKDVKEYKSALLEFKKSL